MLKEGFQSKYYTYELRVLAKYFKEEGIKASERKKKIYEFCEQYIPEFNQVTYFKEINSILRYASKKKNKLVVIDKIGVTDNEIIHINSLQLEYNLRKLLFTLTVLNKIMHQIYQLRYDKHNIYNIVGGSKKFYRELVDTSKLPTGTKIDDLMHQLTAKGIIQPLDKLQIKLNYIEDIKDSENIMFEISEFDRIGYYYDYHTESKNVIKCVKCGSLVKTRGKNHKMCKECWSEENKLQIKNRVNKYRRKKRKV